VAGAGFELILEFVSQPIIFYPHIPRCQGASLLVEAGGCAGSNDQEPSAKFYIDRASHLAIRFLGCCKQMGRPPLVTISPE
jgi:hypothetical protein